MTCIRCCCSVCLCIDKETDTEVWRTVSLVSAAASFGSQSQQSVIVIIASFAALEKIHIYCPLPRKIISLLNGIIQSSVSNSSSLLYSGEVCLSITPNLPKYSCFVLGYRHTNILPWAEKGWDLPWVGHSLVMAWMHTSSVRGDS